MLWPNIHPGPRVAQLCQHQPCPDPPSQTPGAPSKSRMTTHFASKGDIFGRGCACGHPLGGTSEWGPPSSEPPPRPAQGLRVVAPFPRQGLFPPPSCPALPARAHVPSQGRAGPWSPAGLPLLIAFLPLDARAGSFPCAAGPRPARAARGGGADSGSVSASPSTVSFVPFSSPFLLPPRAQPL